MNVVFYMENNHAGGMDTFLINLINNWDSCDKVTIVCNKNHPGLLILKSKIKGNINCIDYDIKTGYEIADKTLFFTPIIIRKIVRQILKIFLSYYQFKSLKKIFSKISSQNLIVVNGGYPGGETSRLASIAWASLGREKNIHTFHNFSTKPFFLMKFFENFIDKKLEKSVTHMVSVSKACLDSIKLRKHFKKNNKLSYIFNGVSFNDLDSSTKLNLRKSLNIKNGLICLMLGTYEKRKGHEFLINSFNRACLVSENLYLVICGDSYENDKKYVEKIRNNSVFKKKIFLLNYIKNGKDLINQSDIVLISSQEWESFGFTAVEAMARKKPVISTNIGGLREVVGTHLETGFLFEKNDIDGFSEAIIKLSSDERLRKKIGLNGYERGKQLFDVNIMSRKYKNLISQGY